MQRRSSVLMGLTACALLLAQAVSGGCTKRKPQSTPAPAEAGVVDTQALQAELTKAKREAEEWRAKAKALESELAEAKKPPKAPPKQRNEDRPVGDRVVRGWDTNYRLWRDIRIKDFDWKMSGTRIGFGVSKEDRTVLIEIKDQVAEAWVLEYVTGKKVDIPTR